ncbi:MAG TPA: BPSS1780 family membrane protein [Burkholderiales bacterium]|nr:BPSS1780 family membrane protein [Burkholderiales bacterium]
MSTNPYAAPRSAVADVINDAIDGDFIPDGQVVSIGNAWPWITQGWRLFREQPGMWIGGLLLIALILMAIAFIPYAGIVAMALLYPIFGGGIMIGANSVWKNGSMEFGHFFAGFQNRFGALATLGVIFMLCSLVINLLIASIAGLDATYFFNPGSELPENLDWQRYWLGTLVGLAIWVPIYMTLWFAPALVLLNDMSVAQAMKTSFLACLKNFLPFLLYGVLLTVLTIVSAIPLGLGLFITMPLWVITIYTAYRDIFYLD